MMHDILSNLVPELMLTGVACILFLLGCSSKRTSRRIAPFIALLALLIALFSELAGRNIIRAQSIDSSIFVTNISHFIRALAAIVGIVLLLLAWPSNSDMTGNSALNFGHDAGEFFALFLLSISGLMLVSVANDLVLLFLALELVSIPTYIMVSISRPVSAAQEAGVKYFFLGSLSVAIMLFGFSYLYGATGQINLPKISAILQQTISTTGNLAPWQKIGVLLVILGLAFKMAAFPLHFYAGDVYEGAATPVTAFLAFVPKTAGFIALLKILSTVGGNDFALLPHQLTLLLWILAALTMTVGNVLGLLQTNVKRVLAYSSIAHTGYMLVGVASLASVTRNGDSNGLSALTGILFYLAGYGIMNAAAFGVLMLLPASNGEGAAETFDDLAGAGRRHVALALAMSVSCFSLIGIPLTVGFAGKLFLILPALRGGLTLLVIILIVNAAISAAYYLRIVATLFLRPAPAPEVEGATLIVPAAPKMQPAILIAVIASVIGMLIFGTIPQATEELYTQAKDAANSPSPTTQPTIASAPP